MGRLGASHEEPAAYTIAPVPYRSRVIRGGIALAVGMAMFAWLFIGSMGEQWFLALAFLAVSCWVAWKLYDETEIKRLTRIGSEYSPAAKAEMERLRQLEADAVKRKNAKALAGADWLTRNEHKWWVRYPTAALLSGGCLWLVKAAPGLWWVAAIGAIYAAVLARELVLVLLAIGAVWWLSEGIAALPVSAAIILGAIIIASALRK